MTKNELTYITKSIEDLKDLIITETGKLNADLKTQLEAISGIGNNIAVHAEKIKTIKEEMIKQEEAEKVVGQNLSKRIDNIILQVNSINDKLLGYETENLKFRGNVKLWIIMGSMAAGTGAGAGVAKLLEFIK